MKVTFYGTRGSILFHHDPEHDDTFLIKVEKECQRLMPDSFLAREGLVITL